MGVMGMTKGEKGIHETALFALIWGLSVNLQYTTQ